MARNRNIIAWLSPRDIKAQQNADAYLYEVANEGRDWTRPSDTQLELMESARKQSAETRQRLFALIDYIEYNNA